MTTTAPSLDGTLIPSEYITDKAGNTWTLKNGVIYKNGVKEGDCSDVAYMLWYGGKIYCQSALDGKWYVNATVPNRWLGCTDPRVPVTPPCGTHHGINGKYDYRYTADQVVQILLDMGMSMYRVGCVNNSAQISSVTKLAKAFQAVPGLTLYVLVNYGIRDASDALFRNEQAAYDYCYAGAAAVARAMQPYGVKWFECGNELTRRDEICPNQYEAGTKVVDFDNTNWPLMRGAMRGMMAGVKSVIPDAKCGINFCVNDVGASDALWDGVQPDQSTGHPKVRWDHTTWHNYEVYGDIFDLGTDGAGPGFDLPIYVKARYGKPFLLTEWSCGPERDQAYRAGYITECSLSYFDNRKAENILSVFYYCLDSGNQAYGLMIDGVVNELPYGATCDFIAGHPDV
jgi:hypothetical protein